MTSGLIVRLLPPFNASSRWGRDHQMRTDVAKHLSDISSGGLIAYSARSLTVCSFARNNA